MTSGRDCPSERRGGSHLGFVTASRLQRQQTLATFLATDQQVFSFKHSIKIHITRHLSVSISVLTDKYVRKIAGGSLT